jgi:cephalosporin hydroxylase
LDFLLNRNNGFGYALEMANLTSNPRFFGKEYIAALEQHYPEFIEGLHRQTVDRRLHIGFVERWINNLDIVGAEGPDRYQRIVDRPWSSAKSAWGSSGSGPNLRHMGACGSYKGLIQLKPAIDLVLYSNLIWELEPNAILEFGSLQGGSGLWLADQLEILCGRGEVHSFELCYKCISERASHPRLKFHQADLSDLKTLDRDLLHELPHPWLVVDDAHANLTNLIPFIADFMKPGDYYVIEDVLTNMTSAGISAIVRIIGNLGFMVDTRYTDAFGINVTCAPNGWLMKL